MHLSDHGLRTTPRHGERQGFTVEFGSKEVEGVTVSSTKSVDCLEGVADGDEATQRGSGEHAVKQCTLHAVGVLCFVDEDEVEFVGGKVPQEWEVEHVVEVDDGEKCVAVGKRLAGVFYCGVFVAVVKNELEVGDESEPFGGGVGEKDTEPGVLGETDELWYEGLVTLEFGPLDGLLENVADFVTVDLRASWKGTLELGKPEGVEGSSLNVGRKARFEFGGDAFVEGDEDAGF